MAKLDIDLDDLAFDKLAKDTLWNKPQDIDWDNVFDCSVREPCGEVVLPYVGKADLDEYLPNWESEWDSLAEALEDFEGTSEFDAWRESFVPMMNYAYPVRLSYDADPREIATRIEAMAGCVVLVDIDGEHFLALCGGGMDLSWEICAAYLAAGCVPPLHFLRDLPVMADKPSGPVDDLILNCIPGVAAMLSIEADRLERSRFQFLERAKAATG